LDVVGCALPSQPTNATAESIFFSFQPHARARSGSFAPGAHTTRNVQTPMLAKLEASGALRLKCGDLKNVLRLECNKLNVRGKRV
jgi:hypothetical protein